MKKISLLVLIAASVLTVSCERKDHNQPTSTKADQPQSDNDRNVSARIRRSIIASDSLSNRAKNIKIITVDGVVTLKGPVNNENEKAEVVRKAKEIAPGKVVEQIEIVEVRK